MAKKIKIPELADRIEFEAIVDNLACATVDLRKLTASRDAKLQVIREQHDPAIAVLQDDMDAMADTLEQYATAHRDELMPDAVKSNETSLATYGFRFGSPALVLINKKAGWDAVIKALKRLRLKHLIRTTEAADKDKIKDANLTPRKMEALGVKVAQPETFYVEPKDQASDARAT